MNAEFLAVLEHWEKEKGISKDTLLRAVEDALVASAKKAVGPARDLSCQIDPKSGDIRAYAQLVVVEKVTSKHDEISVTDAQKLKPGAVLGDEVTKEVTPENFGRIAAQTARQALIQAVRRAEKALIYDEFKDRSGDIVSGIVRRFDRSDVTIDLGRFEALLPNRERVPTEEYQIGDRLRCYVVNVENNAHGPDIILSRAHPQFVIKLFKMEVSEINDGTIEIKGIAREPGFRTKLAVYSRDEKVDPVGACVGLRGQRVKNIVRELNNEKIDIIRWDPDVKIFIANALAPAKLRAFEIDEKKRLARILVNEDQLSLAIGKRGQNARLTSKLTGWHVDIEAERIEQLGFEQKVAQAVGEFARIQGITSEMAETLVQVGFHTIEDLVQTEAKDLQEIPQIGDQAESVLEAARQESKRRNQQMSEGPSE